MKQDIALPYKKDKKSKKNSFKKFLKKLFKDPPKNLLVRIITYIGFALAIIAFILAFIPVVSNLAIWVAVLAVAFELFGSFKKDGSLSKKMLIISASVLVIAVASVTIQNIYNQSQIDRQMYLKSGDATEELLDKDVTVNILGWNDSGLDVKLKNNNSASKGYGVEIEARSKDNSVIVSEMVSPTSIAPGKESTLTIFRHLSETQKEALKNDAEYKILSVSQF
ncbi:hypothetical protein LJC64_01680 [Ruminococcaceae bacterium OttesenSCG-928-A11]|nr:hypothetical protein [Ruminococcaceae bacterium OttesenSCG-928-A11]